jgi:hypothetical protein
MTRAAARRTLVAAGLVLLAGLLLAPSLPTGTLPTVSVVWLFALAALARGAYLVLHHWMRRGPALALSLLGLASPVLLTSVTTSPRVAIHLPCHRNWVWMPTWLLRSSPMGSTVFRVGGRPVKICYGRPAARGRVMLGGPRVPFGRLWRTGANEPTTIISAASLEVAGVVIPPGRHTLYTVPGPETWEIILNGATSQWGIESEYTPEIRREELGRGIVRSEIGGGYVERLTLTADPRPDGTADLVLRWESTRVRIRFRSVSR